MQVTRVEIFGFKSFMERVILPLEGGLTTIVGPNGCGKSNVVDAVRWVLGETRAKSLRGGVLEDVIFNGTDKLRPLGLAEVTLTLRANSENFFADLVSPSLEADIIAQQALESDEEVEDGDSQLEEDSTSERPKLKVISGGISNDESSDALEQDSSEVNVASDDEKKSSADVSATLLNRFAWLRSTSEIQVTRRLYRSGESEFFINRVACRLKDLKDLFQAVNLSARAYTVVAQGEVARMVTAKPEERRLILEEAAGVVGLRDKIATAERRLGETSTNISRLEDIVREVSRQVNSLKRQASRARARQRLKERQAELDRIIFQDKWVGLLNREQEFQSKLAELRDGESSTGIAFQTARSKEQAARAELVGVDVEADAIRERLDSIKEELSERGRQRTRKESRISELSSLLISRRNEIERLESRCQTLTERMELSEKEVSVLRSRDSELSEEIASIGKGSDEELRDVAEQLRQARLSLQDKDRELRSCREELVRRTASLEAIRKQLVAASPANQLKKTLGGEGRQLLEDLCEHTRLFVDGLNVPEQYAAAVQAVLAEKAGFLLADNPYRIARSFAEKVLAKDPRNIHGLGLGIFKTKGVVDDSLGEMRRNNDIPFQRLIDCVSAKDECALIADRLLGDVYIVDSLQIALDYFENDYSRNNSAESVTLVTRDGDLVTDISFFSLRNDGGLVQLRNEAVKLEEECREAEVQKDSLSDELKQRQTSVQQAEERHRLALTESQRRQERIRELSKNQGAIRGRIEAEKRLSSHAEQDISDVRQQIRDGALKIDEYEKEKENVEQEMAALAEDEDHSLREQLSELNEEMTRVEAVRREGRNKLSELADQAEVARKELDSLRSESSQAELALQKVELEREAIIEKIEDEYGEDVLEEVRAVSIDSERLDEVVRGEHIEEVRKIKERIVREGEVDPSSIERYEEEQQRLDDLSAQKKDLEEAASALRRTVSKLQETLRERFLITFEQVNKNFSKLIPRLFGGGKGAIELLDPSNPLSSGIGIIARPPGKKLKSIELLSGGEKALCATALVLGIFMVRPSPLCILDEVDAPLDDANLVRFLSLIRELSTKTQYVLISHNKQTMTAADRLVGVTMEEPGATKLITVSLEDAVKQVA